jgi:AcrR family transcriptional regulator
MSVTANRATETRAALVAAAERLFRTNGYGATTMADIAAAAGVSRPTAFRYFRTKADLVFSVQDEWQQTVRRVIAEQPGTGWALVQRVCDAVVDEIEQDADRVLAAYRLAGQEPSLAAAAAARDRDWIHLVAELLASGPADASADDPAGEDRLLTGAAIMGMISMAVSLWADASGTIDLRRTIQRGLDLLHAGLGT